MHPAPTYDEYKAVVEYLIYKHKVKGCAMQVGFALYPNILTLVQVAIGAKILKHADVTMKSRLWIIIIATSCLISSFCEKPVLTSLLYNAICALSLYAAFKKVSGYVVLGVNIAILVALQLSFGYFGAEMTFFAIRGILMMNIMRLTTVAFKTSDTKGEVTMNQMVNYVEYVYYTPFIIFGPYLTFEQFIQMRDTPWRGALKEFGCGLKSLIMILIGMTFAIGSSCHSVAIITNNEFQENMVTAMSFRFGHYFVCLITQGFIWFLGSDITVVNPFKVELSRSTLQTVCEWNRQFHTFLHEYVFKRHFFNSTALNVLLTFVVSGLLHGLDIHMILTLAALGFIAYAETVFRKRLADRLSMCICARPCKVVDNRLTCNHRHTSNIGLAGFINIIFMLLSIYHLIFTGMTFVDQYSPTGYPILHAVKVWKSHYYASFVISLVFLVFSKIL